MFLLWTDGLVLLCHSMYCLFCSLSDVISPCVCLCGSVLSRRRSLDFCFPLRTFSLTMSNKVSWATADQYLEHTETQIDVDLWFFLTPHITLLACNPSQVLVDMDFLWKAPSRLLLEAHLTNVLQWNQLWCIFTYWSVQRHGCACHKHAQWLIFFPHLHWDKLYSHSLISRWLEAILTAWI